jgi:peptide/nickel transport system permease protein
VHVTDLAKQDPAAPAEEVPLGDVEPDVLGSIDEVVAIPIWRVRLRLMRRSLARNWALFAENKIGFVGLAIIAVFALMAVLQPILIATVWDPRVYDPQTGYDAPVTEYTVVEEVTDPTTEMDVQTARLETTPFVEVGDVVEIPTQPAQPTFTGEYPHFLGTDPLGRDILSQLMYGARAAFFLGSVAALVTVIIATTVGSVAAHFGGWVDSSLMRLADLILLVPLIPVLIVVASLFAVSLPLLGLLIGILSGFGGVAIVLKSQALSVRVKPFIDAARVAGGGDWHVIFRHIVPNVLPLSFLYMMFGVTEAISLEATLSFLGLLNVPMSWGIMINTAANQGYLLGGTDYWWLLLPAGLAVTMLAFAFFLVGRAMDEVVNPRLRAR